MKKMAFLLVGLFVGFGAYADGQIINETVFECDGQECAKRPRSSEIVGGCTADEVGHDCTQPSGRADRAKCVKITTESGGTETYSCAAKQCKDNYWLWVSGGHSMGVCHSIEETIRFCKKNGTCGEGCDCVPNEIPNPNKGYGGKAYDECHCVPKQSVIPPAPEDECVRDYIKYGLRAVECCKLKEQGVLVEWNVEKNICECTEDNKELNKDGKCVDKEKPEETPDVEGDCRYTFRGLVTCNGKKVFKFKSFKLTKKQAKDWNLPSCKDGETITIDDQFKQNSEEFKKIVEEVCGKPNQYNGVPVPDDNGGDDNSFLDAQNRIDAFIRNANLNVSVWKNADGKFNTSRLASDLTAGVVLGTVGGLVSANIIKKKQLEKGYDALHCAIGGHKVADWGDVFEVGLRWY